MPRESDLVNRALELAGSPMRVLSGDPRAPALEELVRCLEVKAKEGRGASVTCIDEIGPDGTVRRRFVPYEQPKEALPRA